MQQIINELKLVDNQLKNEGWPESSFARRSLLNVIDELKAIAAQQTPAALPDEEEVPDNMSFEWYIHATLVKFHPDLSFEKREELVRGMQSNLSTPTGEGEAVAFGNWLMDEWYVPNGHIGRWFLKPENKLTQYSTEELYKQFKQQP